MGRDRSIDSNPRWLKFAYRYGVWKTVSIYFLLAVAVIWGMLYILSIIYRPGPTWLVVSITITTSTVTTLMFYQHLKKALEGVEHDENRD
ncbi:MAG: hypothetical protein OEZ48_07820 [Candidatus Bathyarchaeota archaeon]|nr:hypothetical protein [Candidatus Bathyarchaeota archaeon]